MAYSPPDDRLGMASLSKRMPFDTAGTRWVRSAVIMAPAFARMGVFRINLG